MDQASAKAYCKSLDKQAHLAELRTQEIQEFVTGLNGFQTNGNHWWLGGSNQVKL